VSLFSPERVRQSYAAYPDPLFNTTVSIPIPAEMRAALKPTTPAPNTRVLPGLLLLLLMRVLLSRRGPLKVKGSDKGSHPSCNLAHWNEERKAAVSFKGLISDPGYFFAKHKVCQPVIGGKVQIGEDSLAFRKYAYSSGRGSFTFTIKSDFLKSVSLSTMSASAAR